MWELLWGKNIIVAFCDNRIPSYDQESELRSSVAMMRNPKGKHLKEVHHRRICGPSNFPFSPETVRIILPSLIEGGTTPLSSRRSPVSVKSSKPRIALDALPDKIHLYDSHELFFNAQRKESGEKTKEDEKAKRIAARETNRMRRYAADGNN